MFCRHLAAVAKPWAPSDILSECVGDVWARVRKAVSSPLSMSDCSGDALGPRSESPAQTP
eukprot:10985602-Lingulodinium_polyedra.AAC.1